MILWAYDQVACGSAGCRVQQLLAAPVSRLAVLWYDLAIPCRRTDQVAQNTGAAIIDRKRGKVKFRNGCSAACGEVMG